MSESYERSEERALIRALQGEISMLLKDNEKLWNKIAKLQKERNEAQDEVRKLREVIEYL